MHEIPLGGTAGVSATRVATDTTTAIARRMAAPIPRYPDSAPHLYLYSNQKAHFPLLLHANGHARHCHWPGSAHAIVMVPGLLLLALARCGSLRLVEAH